MKRKFSIYVISSDFSLENIGLLELTEFSLISTEKVSVNLSDMRVHPANKIVANQIIPNCIKM